MTKRKYDSVTILYFSRAFEVKNSFFSKLLNLDIQPLCSIQSIYAYLYICINMNSSMSVCVYARSGRGNVLYRRGSCPGVSCPGGGRGPFPMRRRARGLVPYATMYTSAFISVRQQAFKAPAYEGVSKCIFSCFIYYGVKANVRSFGVNSIQMLFISQTTNSKLS